MSPRVHVVVLVGANVEDTERLFAVLCSSQYLEELKLALLLAILDGTYRGPVAIAILVAHGVSGTPSSNNPSAPPQKQRKA